MRPLVVLLLSTLAIAGPALEKRGESCRTDLRDSELVRRTSCVVPAGVVQVLGHRVLRTAGSAVVDFETCIPAVKILGLHERYFCANEGGHTEFVGMEFLVVIDLNVFQRLVCVGIPIISKIKKIPTVGQYGAAPGLVSGESYGTVSALVSLPKPFFSTCHQDTFSLASADADCGAQSFEAPRSSSRPSSSFRSCPCVERVFRGILASNVCCASSPQRGPLGRSWNGPGTATARSYSRGLTMAEVEGYCGEEEPKLNCRVIKGALDWEPIPWKGGDRMRLLGAAEEFGDLSLMHKTTCQETVCGGFGKQTGGVHLDTSQNIPEQGIEMLDGLCEFPNTKGLRIRPALDLTSTSICLLLHIEDATSRFVQVVDEYRTISVSAAVTG
ncbi:uncharacterized protein MYCFIDRAFT_176926 [Pseudocercospora fijiensis CIRAD86]|uniref:Uncharacterized protein n=1 Tax=Pseudocercospora fijiensis (strain CIRAD86) TaxID=383855 RepID=M3AS22_PSEFD|nr:uncharacterized protein MYCFIDRAFT_176926 [Pseudocercospora fijiensis CIRAD86]EME79928.1 hypothetical protein MYCFIDRAFT_176926 [Pseudocercospora fijiensis CIRAD86]